MYHDGRDTRNCPFRGRGKSKTLINLISGQGIELVFFHDYKTIGLMLVNLNRKKWVPADVSKNNLSQAIK
jgi:hypothetical protein